MSNKNNRIEFHNILVNAIGIDKASHVYFQPPESLQLMYPAIIYHRNSIDNTHADNIIYSQGTLYQVVVIDKNPDSDIVNNVSRIPTARYNRHYFTSGLNHDVFLINYK